MNVLKIAPMPSTIHEDATFFFISLLHTLAVCALETIYNVKNHAPRPTRD